MLPNFLSRLRFPILSCVCAALLGGCPGEIPTDGPATSSGSGKKPLVAYITNSVASFWLIAEVGAKKAAEEFDVDVDVRMPPNAQADEQKRFIEELLARGVSGVAISPIDPENQADILNTCAEHAHLITQDSDAPNSKRLCYVGVGNYDAGRMCGQLVKEAMPDGGSLMIFVGRMAQDNAKYRRQGLIDELLDKPHNPDGPEYPIDKVIRDNKYEVLGTRTDDFVFTNARALAEDALTANPDLGCMVGLFAYNPPYILEALKSAGKIGQVKLVGFDEADETLQAIADGGCHGTVVQDPYQYGYQSVKILAGLARGDQSVLPPDGFLNVPARKITRENVEEFRANLKELTGSK